MLLVGAAAVGAQGLAQIRMTDGSLFEGVPEAIVRLDEEIAEGLPAYDLIFRGGGADEMPSRLPLHDVLQIRWRPTETLTVVSGPETQWANLSEEFGESVPSMWTEDGGSLIWGPAQAPQIYHRWRHVPGAQWVWSDANWHSSSHRERVAFRQVFEVPAEMRVVEATLLIAVDDELEMGDLNGVALPLEARASEPRLWEVTQAIRPGLNRIGLVARDTLQPTAPHATQINAGGLVFRLEIVGVRRSDSTGLQPTCVAHLDNGDRLCGQLERLDDRRVRLETELGDLVIDRDWVSEIFISAPRSAGRRFSLREKATPTEPLVHTVPRNVPLWAPGLLLNDGTQVRGRILRADDREVLIKPRYSDEAEVPLSEIHAIYINAARERSHFHYPLANGPRVCRLTTVGGNRLSGLVSEISETVTIKTPEMEVVEIPADRLLSVTFPMSSRLWAWRDLARVENLSGRSFAIWGRRQGDRQDLPYSADTVAQIYQISRDLGFELEWIDDATLASGALRRESHPVLFVVDEREEFPLSVGSPGDGLEALTSYVRGGGRLILIPAGIPFYHGREWADQRWMVRPLRQDIPRILGFHYLAPGRRHAEARAFEIPDNRGDTLVFERVSASSRWRTLPSTLRFAPVGDARFRPIMSLGSDSAAAVEPIYRLTGGNGEEFGTAMAVVRHTRGDLVGSRIYHVTPALAQVTDEAGEPALHRLLPAVITDALVGDFVSEVAVGSGAVQLAAEPPPTALR
jgi:hypothetical protein